MTIDISPDVRPPTRSSAHVRVAIFDRRPLAADGFAALLSHCDEVEIVGVGTSVHAAVRLLASTRVDVVVIGIPSVRAAVVERLLGRVPAEQLTSGPRIVGVVSGDQDLADLLSGSSMTVLTTQVDPDTLRETVISEIPSGVVAISPLMIRPPSGTEESSGPPHPRLTPREQDVLHGIESGLSTHEIALNLGIAANTVRTHAQRLMSKLAVHSRVQAAAIAAAESRSSLVEG